ncbi:hypothetical protein EV424DRAFT_1342862 [Suillus variegatus]|nr:hypothetical protein EV424DRAFT_1342862 [Suillus variegatus]
MEGTNFCSAAACITSQTQSVPDLTVLGGMSLQTCLACGCNNFTVTGLSQHLAKSHDSRCQALYRNSCSRTNPNPVNKTTKNFAPESGHPKGNYSESISGYFEAEGDTPKVHNSTYFGYFETEGLILHSQGEDSGSDDHPGEDLDESFFEPEWEVPVPSLPEDGTFNDTNLPEDGTFNDTNLPEDGTFDNTCQDIEARAQGQHGYLMGDSTMGQASWSANTWGLSFKNANELNKLINHELPTGQPKFKREQVIVTGEAFDSLYGNPDFARYLTFALEWHYADDDETVRLFHDMHMGKWWWEMQKKLNELCPGGTIVPIIISSNKTQVTMFRNKTAYPMYLTIGNILKELRHKPSSGSHILLAYLPTSRLEHIPNKASCCRAIANLYHRAFQCIAVMVLVVIAIHDVEAKDTGSNTTPFHLRSLSEVLDALAAFKDRNLVFVCACTAAGIKPIIHPFWEDLPFTNIFRAITPDVLHQLYQGRLLQAVRSLLDFLYLVQYPCHSSETLHSLDRALDLFHENKDSFIQLSIHNNFNLPKLHAAHHYHLMITLFSTTDNYNTKYTKHLHIDLAKDAYHATNHKDEFIQMTCWLEQKEKILQHQRFVSWCLAGGHQFEPYHLCPPDMTFCQEQVMTKHPTVKAVSIQKLVEDLRRNTFSRGPRTLHCAQTSR